MLGAPPPPQEKALSSFIHQPLGKNDLLKGGSTKDLDLYLDELSDRLPPAFQGTDLLLKENIQNHPAEMISRSARNRSST